MRLLKLALLSSAALFAADPAHPTPQFTDPERRTKLAVAFPAIEQIFAKFQQERRIPSLVFGVVIDRDLAFVKGFGLPPMHRPVNADTVFRIASMTKSFTALAILKLRDEGKLSLEDPVSKWIPELAKIPYPTRDTAPIRIRQLLTHGAGFPEDNPWGDQQLGESDETLTNWLNWGIPFSRPPDTAFEYSNYGFALLGRIVSAASGMPYQKYLESQILTPLGMRDTTLEPSRVPSEHLVEGYRFVGEHGGAYEIERPLRHGSFGAMGGLLTNARDLAKYIAFQLSAWPPRDDDDPGPVRRSSLREMQHPWRLSDFSAGKDAKGNFRASTGAYGYGLGVTRDCCFDRIVSHSGGLPGWGSFMVWLPNEGVGILAMANFTYSAPSAGAFEALDALYKTGALQPRVLPPAPILTSTRDTLVRLWNRWEDAPADRMAAMNLFLDKSVTERKKEIADLKERVGNCSAPGAVQPEDWLRGAFRIPCERGSIEVRFTLAPTQPPKVQFLRFGYVAEPNSAAVPPPPPRCNP